MRLLCAALLATALAAQSRPLPATLPVASQRFMPASRLWSILVPAQWRQLTPDEARHLGEKGTLPEDLRKPTPGRDFALGAVDTWLGKGFTGVSLSVIEEDSELQLDETAVQHLGESLGAAARQRGLDFALLGARLVAVGEPVHQAIEVQTRVETVAKGPLFRTHELFVPTGGRLIGLRFRAPEAGFASQQELFGAMARSLTFARAQAKPSARSNKLLWAAAIGALVGMLLLVLRKRAETQGP